MALTIYQRSYIAALKNDPTAQALYIQSKYDTNASAATGGDTGSTSKYKAQRTREQARIHAYTKKLTLANGGVSA